MATKEVLQKGSNPKTDATMSMAEIAKYYLGRGKKGAEAKPAQEPQEEPKEAAPRRPSVMGEKNPANKEALEAAGMKCGGTVKKYAKGGMIDGAAQRGKTRGKMC